MAIPYRPLRDRIEMIEEFERAPDSALFRAESICAVLDWTRVHIDTRRHQGKGPPCFKVGGGVRYRKVDVVEFIQKEWAKIEKSDKAA